MTTFRFRKTAHSPAEPEALWDLVTDPVSWPQWTSFVPNGRWETAGRTGPGASRVMGIGRFGMRETVAAEERPDFHEYTIADNPMMRNYRARVSFTAAPGGGTEVEWVGSFDAVPGVGHALHQTLSRVIGRILADLVRAAS